MKADPTAISAALPIIGVTASSIALALTAIAGIEWALLPFLSLLVVNVVLGLANARRWRYRPGREPTPPTNVRIETRWGVEIPVQCVYAGRFDGVHRWEVIRPVGVTHPGDVAQVHIGVLPGHTAIALFRAEGAP